MRSARSSDRRRQNLIDDACLFARQRRLIRTSRSIFRDAHRFATRAAQPRLRALAGRRSRGIALRFRSRCERVPRIRGCHEEIAETVSAHRTTLGKSRQIPFAESARLSRESDMNPTGESDGHNNERISREYRAKIRAYQYLCAPSNCTAR